MKTVATGAAIAVMALALSQATAVQAAITRFYITEDCDYDLRSSGASKTINDSDSYVTVSNGVTITFRQLNGEEQNRRSLTQWLIEGDVTFDFTPFTGSNDPLFQGSLIIRPGSTLTVKYEGTKTKLSLCMGRAGDTSTGESISIYMLGGLQLEGAKVKALSFAYPIEMRECHDQSMWAGSFYNLNSGNSVPGLSLSGTGSAAPFIDGDGDLSINNNICIYERTALPAGAGVKVAAGKTLYLKPAAYVGNSFNAANLNCNRTILGTDPLSGGWEDPVTVTAMGAGSKVVASAGAKVAFAAGVSAWSRTEDGTTIYEPTTTGALISLAGAASAKANARVCVDSVSDAVLADVSSSTPPIVAKTDTTIDLSMATAAPTVYANEGITTIREGDGTRTICGLEPRFWLDASVTNSFTSCSSRTNENVSAGYAPGTLYRRDPDTDELQLIVEQWSDCRTAADAPYGSDLCLFQNYFYGSSPSSSSVNVHPYLVTQGSSCPNGMPYLSFGSKQSGYKYGVVLNAEMTQLYNLNGTSARLRLANGGMSQTACPTESTLTGVKTVVMVFGSQFGGGAAPIGTSQHKFQRREDGISANTTLDTPVTMQTDWPMWLNGERVVPNETKFSGGWDVLTICTTNLSVNGLGLDQVKSFAYAGQNYAEVIFFNEELTDLQRTRVETVLARKWGLTAKYPGSPTPVASAKLMGAGTNGTVRLQMDLTISGTFSGTLELDGANVTVADLAKPATAADVPTDGCVGWYDPSAADAFSLYTGTYAGSIKYLWNILAGPDSTGIFLPYGSGARSPDPVVAARGFAAETTWLDCNGTTNNAIGNLLRFQFPEASGTDITTNIRSVVMVQDSCRGGGTPFSSLAINGYPYRNPKGDWTSPIWTDSIPTGYTNATVRLDGSVVDAFTDGFQGCPEVLTVQAAPGAANDLPVGAFGDYRNTDQSFTGSRFVRYGEIFGEMLLYVRDLSDSERNAIECYLMNKWLNKVPAGYGDLSRATLSGAGSLAAAKWSQVPRIDPAFTGTVTVQTVDEMSFSVAEDGTVAGAIICPDATIDLPASVAATVAVSRDTPPGRYTLIDCDHGETTFNIAVVSQGSRPCSIRSIGNACILEVRQRGTAILLK